MLVAKKNSSTYVCVAYFLQPNQGATAHGTARKTMTMAMSPIKMLRNRKKQAAATTIASLMMMNAASRKLLKKKTASKTMFGARNDEKALCSTRPKKHSLTHSRYIVCLFSRANIYVLEICIDAINARVRSMGHEHRSIHPLKGRNAHVHGTTFSPCGRYLLTAFLLYHLDMLDRIVRGMFIFKNESYCWSTSYS